MFLFVGAEIGCLFIKLKKVTKEESSPATVDWDANVKCQKDLMKTLITCILRP